MQESSLTQVTLLKNDSINHLSWQCGAKMEQRFYFVRRLDLATLDDVFGIVVFLS